MGNGAGAESDDRAKQMNVGNLSSETQFGKRFERGNSNRESGLFNPQKRGKLAQGRTRSPTLTGELILKPSF